MSTVFNGTLAKVKSFAKLQKGWCYGMGDALSSKVIDYATEWLITFFRQGFAESNVFPGADGEILLSIYVGEANLDLTVYPDGEASLVAEVGSTEVFHLPKCSVAQINDGIKVALAVIWNMSVFSTPNTSIIAGVASRVSPSKTHPGTVERRYSNSIAVSRSPAPSALTSNGSIQTWGVIQQSTGSLRPITYHPQAA